MTQTLEQLSAAATDLSPCPFCGREPHIIERVTGPNGPGFFCAVSCYCGGYSAKAHQSATSNNDQMARVEAITRWNQRTGQLVAVSDDAIERVARAISDAAANVAGINVDAMVERLLWHVEQCLGPISRETREVAGDDDYSILKHNFECILATEQMRKEFAARKEAWEAGR